MSGQDVICHEAGSCGLITLNRPEALNALTLPMVRDIAAALDRWESDSAIKTVAIRGAGGKAFCAGGDIRILYDLGKAGHHDEQLAFWREEYCLNRRIKLYSKPYIALTDGIVMGGGAGLSVHGSHLIAGENLIFAMPETGIGFIPDVGATYFLPRLPACAGVYLALTGARMSCGDALFFGLACAHVPACRHDKLMQRLIRGEPVESAIAAESGPPPLSALSRDRALIAHCFSAGSVPAILGRLDEAGKSGSAFARAAADAIRAKSPLSLVIALRQLQMGEKLCIGEALQTEFRLVSRLARSHDFYEGIRALIIDKDKKPKWSPESVEQIAPAAIDAYFAPLASGELDFGSGRSG
ncbi:MAG TPA: enoyl-CoA hydratase/isomerase family protein [Methylocella sp.]|nr:enoyl-CoA hydratase/isomerase family protein [Methylocella sp.]